MRSLDRIREKWCIDRALIIMKKLGTEHIDVAYARNNMYR